MMRNYNEFIQNQNIIQAPPSMEIKNPLNNNINQAPNTFINNNNHQLILNNKNIMPNGSMNGFNLNNVVGAPNADIMNLSKQLNMNGK